MAVGPVDGGSEEVLWNGAGEYVRQLPETPTNTDRHGRRKNERTLRRWDDLRKVVRVGLAAYISERGATRSPLMAR